MDETPSEHTDPTDTTDTPDDDHGAPGLVPGGFSGDKDLYLRRLRRVEGQVRGLQRMVENDTYCIDVLTQLAAVTKALQAVGLGLLEDHVNHCVVGAAKQSDEAGRAKVAEATAAVARLMRA